MNKGAKIILALDVDDFKRAKFFIDKLIPKIKIFKVGAQLFTGCGPKIVEYIHKKNAEVFLDLKFHDIPNTVARALRQAVRFKIKMLTLHISGREDMLKAAVEAAQEESLRARVRRPLLIGVTVLTSLEASPEEVLRLARIGLGCGLDGVVASAKEAALLRKALGEKFVIISPGIRPPGAKGDDQKRVASVQEAIQAGSDYLVVGRPILEAKDPLAALREMMQQHKMTNE